MFEKMFVYNLVVIIQFNIDIIESCIQLLVNVDVFILEIGVLNIYFVGMCIGVDYGKVVKQIVIYLVDVLLKNIVLFCILVNNIMFCQLLSGWNMVMFVLNCFLYWVVIMYLLFIIVIGVNIFKDMMIIWGDLDVLICMLDEMVCGCMMVCYSVGIKVFNIVVIVSLGGGVLLIVCFFVLIIVEFFWYDIGVKVGKVFFELFNDKSGEKFIEILLVFKVWVSIVV